MVAIQASLARQYQAGVIDQLTPYADHLTGWAASDVLLIKGSQAETELTDKKPFSGEYRTALVAALSALGWSDTNWCGVLLEPVEHDALMASDLRLIIEVNDPELIIALDEKARLLLLAAFATDDNQMLFAGSGKNEGIGSNTSRSVRLAEVSTLAGDRDENDIDLRDDISKEKDSPTILGVGESKLIHGRQMLALSDFESSLSNDYEKQLVWAQLKQIRRSSEQK